MAKIRVTENELKQIISESVKQVMKEGIFTTNINYGKRWEELTDDEKQKAAEAFGYADINNPQTQKWVKDAYNKKRNKKINKGKAVWTADQYNQQTQQFNTEKEELNNIITNRDARIEQLTGLIQNISNLLSKVTLPKQNIQEDSSQDVATVAPETNVQNIMAKINYLIGQANQIPRLNNTIAKLQTDVQTLQTTNNNLQAQINQARAQSRIAQTPNPIQAANTRATQAQQNPAGLPQTTTQPRQVAGTYNTPVTQQGRPTA